jgi:hypothetical protein
VSLIARVTALAQAIGADIKSVKAQISAAATALAANVRGTVLTGFVTTTNAAVVATDTVLVAFGKLQAQVAAAYNKSNIVGTVSYSGGITGAIIESGNNANGYFVKYADGTMQCFWLTGTISWSANNSGGVTWTYPAVFDATSVTVWVQATPITNGPHAYNASAIVNNASSATIYMGGSGAANGACYCQATGRWRP